MWTTPLSNPKDMTLLCPLIPASWTDSLMNKSLIATLWIEVLFPGCRVTLHHTTHDTLVQITVTIDFMSVQPFLKDIGGFYVLSKPWGPPNFVLILRRQYRFYLTEIKIQPYILFPCKICCLTQLLHVSFRRLTTVQDHSEHRFLHIIAFINVEMHYLPTVFISSIRSP